ncbi:hypothetical protein BKK79_26270 [Cupriavidus sp. USMAA2-4]|uniref:DUF3613 domain-containing protein n=1 Tax=unclassified Cupriavidus TaxID=2640874 RepID=UPI0008A6C892|nr:MULTISPECIES: DUF3613 domain-containing protein [unclassified Cupriavidus]AOY95285.1 hypothetical protein BKK79_26270 [Cupriavidus sp. USMAA2-4]AOZ01814.1 hypothetical protein BKK81_20825 [Cupriavidus sp. USMAHM13]
MTRNQRHASRPRGIRIALLLALGLPGALAWAQAPAGGGEAAPPELTGRPALRPIGENTRYVLEVQRSGAEAGPLLPMRGEQAALGYLRYMQSFRYQIPEFYSGQTSSSGLRGSAANSSGTLPATAQ